MDLEQFKIEVLYVRKARRATIHLKPDRAIKVTLPYGVKKAEAHRIVREKYDWITKKYASMEQVHAARKFLFISGDELPFYGRKLKLKIIDGTAPVFENAGELIVSIPLNEDEEGVYVRAALMKWYRTQALALINPRVEFYANRLGVKARSVAIRNYRSRWGACSARGELIFNWQILTLEADLFDYVVAHEVCHLLEMNHGPRFYEHLRTLGFERSRTQSRMKHLHNLF